MSLYLYGSCYSRLLVVDLQNGQERLLRDFHGADLLHALLARLLFLQQLPFARDIAAIALRQHVLAQRLYRLARDDMRTDDTLHRHVEHLARNQPAHARGKVRAAILAVGSMPYQVYRIIASAVDHKV